jgi:hypothetical protein
VGDTCSAFGENRDNSLPATCISHIFAHEATSKRWFLWAALVPSPYTAHSFSRQWKRTRTHGFEKALFMLECLLLCVSGYLAVWLRVKLRMKCTLHTCYWLASPNAEQTNIFCLELPFKKLVATSCSGAQLLWHRSFETKLWGSLYRQMKVWSSKNTAFVFSILFKV